jgi:hypothetical protein
MMRAHKNSLACDCIGLGKTDLKVVKPLLNCTAAFLPAPVQSAFFPYPRNCHYRSGYENLVIKKAADAVRRGKSKFWAATPR